MATSRLKLAVFSFLAIGGLAPAQVPNRSDANGDPLPQHALARLGTVRLRHGAAISHVTYTPDGKHLLADSEDGTLRLWDLASGREVRRFAKPERPASAGPQGFLLLFRSASYGTALSPNGRIVAAGSPDGAITLWDPSTGQVIRTLKAEDSSATSTLLFSADNDLLVSKHENGVHRVWDLATGKQMRELGKVPTEQNRVFGFGPLGGSMTFESGGSILAAVKIGFGRNQLGTRIQRWDLVTGRELTSVEIAESQNEFLAFAFSPDGKVLATSGFQGIARLVDTATGKELRKLPGLNMFSFLTQYAFSPDGKIVAGWLGDQTIHLWEVATGKELRIIGEPTGPKFMGAVFFGGQTASNIQFSPDGKHLVLGTSGNTVRRWEVETGKEVLSLPGHQASILRMVLSPDSKTVVSFGADHKVFIWDMATGKEIRRFALPGDATQAAFAPDGQTLATGGNDGTLQTWDIQTGKELRKWQAGQAGFDALAYSADGKTLASRSTDHVIRIWDLATGKEMRQMSEKPEGQRVQGNDFLRSLYSGKVPGACFSQDGTTLATVPPVTDRRLAAFGLDGGQYPSVAIRLWDIGTGRLIRKFQDHNKGFTAFAYAPDGRTLVTADTDGAVILWETITGKVRLRLQTAGLGTLLLPLVGQYDPALQTQAASLFTQFTALAFSPDGRIVAAADSKRTIRFWDAVSGQSIGSLAGHQGKIQTLSWTADGKQLISGSEDTSALVWDVAPLLQSHRTRYPSLEDGRVEGMWNALTGDDSARVYLASLRLMGSPRQVVPFLRDRVRPVQAPDPAKLTQLLTDLDSKQFTARQKASDELEKLGELAIHSVNQALAAKPSLERQQRLERVRERLVAAMNLTAEQRQALRTVEVLERIGTTEAREVLRSLAGGAAGAQVTRHAQAALARQGK